jgi:uncharacterized repeat protein (TIGR03803 family)
MRLPSCLAVVVALLAQDASAQTATVTTLHEFSVNDGRVPTSALLQTPDGNFYGVTQYGGADNDGGTLFRVTPDGGFTTLRTFAGGALVPSGTQPYGALILASNGNIYGTTTRGGQGNCSDGNTLGCGVVFSLTPDGSYNVIYAFSGDPDGSLPSGVIQARDGDLYGVAFLGLHSPPNVYRLTTDGSHSIVQTFNAGDGPSIGANLIQAADGNFYGTQESGGGSDLGVVFRLTPEGVLTGLHSFDGMGRDGASPRAALVEGEDGFLYGTTQQGGGGRPFLGYGTIFRIRPSGADYEVVYQFSGGADGAYPAAAMVEGSDGNIYGTTNAGGTVIQPDCGAGCGTIFRLLPDGTLQTLYAFDIATTGVSPNGLIEGQDRAFYGTTVDGGPGHGGTLFRMRVTEPPPPPPPPPPPINGGGGGGASDIAACLGLLLLGLRRRA